MMLYAPIGLAAVLGLLVPFSAYLWRSRAGEQRAVVKAVTTGALYLEELKLAQKDADYQRAMKEEASLALTRSQAVLDASVGEVANLRSQVRTGETMISGLRLDLARAEGRLEVSRDLAVNMEQRYGLIVGGHHSWRIGGKIGAHGEGPRIQYECGDAGCPVTVLAPQDWHP